MYRILPFDDDFQEICDECGFHGGMVEMGEAAERLRSLRPAWASLFSWNESLARARPEAETWCAVEYAQHTTAAIGAIEWAARLFAEGTSPDWTAGPPGPIAGRFDHEAHDCERFDLNDTLDDLDAAAKSMAELAGSLTPSELAMTADYGGGLIISTAAVIRHALHDAEHHVLDIRRGLARMQLPG